MLLRRCNGRLPGASASDPLSFPGAGADARRRALERIGTVANVVFPTAIDRRDDLGLPDRFDIYYGMADNRIGVCVSTCRNIYPQGHSPMRRESRNHFPSTVTLDQGNVTRPRSRSVEVHRQHDILSHRRPARAGRTLRQYAPLPGG